MHHSFEAKADAAFIHELITQASEAIEEMGIPDDGALRLALHEAVINAYEACLNQGITGKTIKVMIEQADKAVMITVMDPAGNLDPEILNSSGQRLEEANLNLDESGRGLFIIQSLMDEVYVQPVLHNGNYKQKLIMKKVIESL